MLTNFDWVVSSQLKLRFFSSLGICKQARLPSSIISAIIHCLIVIQWSGVRTCYASDGIKQRRVPKYVVVSEGAVFDNAKARPAIAPGAA